MSQPYAQLARASAVSKLRCRGRITRATPLALGIILNSAQLRLGARLPNRKNSLFAGSADHAQNLAIIQSIIATCQLHSVNPYEYVRHMLIEIQTHPASRIAELMPWRWHPPST